MSEAARAGSSVLSPLDAAALLAEDARARRTAQLVFDRPLVLEAGAGTGKTATLVARLVAWSLGPGWERARRALLERAGTPPDADAIAARALGEVTLITFTEAAAAEMAARAGKAFAELARGERPIGVLDEALPAVGEAERRARALAAVGALEHLFIGTIHAFCLRLLAQHPLEAGLHPRPTVDATGAALERVARESVEARLDDLYGEHGAAARDPAALARRASALALAEDGVGPAELAEALAALLAAGAEVADLEPDPLDAAAVARLAARVADQVGRGAASLGPHAGRLGRAKAAQALAEAFVAVREALRAPCADLAALLAAVEPLLATPRKKLEEWRKGEFNKTEQSVLPLESFAELSRDAGAWLALRKHLERLDPAKLAHARLVLVPLLADARESLRRSGLLGFQDLLRGARALLRENSALGRHVRRRIAQLFVDEFQDTDPVQCDLVRCLALEGPRDERPGLFVVGDPKQSIYGWRSADLAAYDAFCAWVVEEGGAVLPLVVNRRSSAAILDEVARAVGPAMQHERGLQPAFQPLLRPPDGVPPEPTPPPGAHAVEYWDTRPCDEGGAPDASVRRAQAVRAEARAIASDVLARRASDPDARWKHFALLLRSTSSLEAYLEEFKRAGIPFAVARERNYYRRREVIDAASLARTVLDPHDQLALVGWLRSAAVGVPDAALLALWRAGLPGAAAALAAPEDHAHLTARAAVENARRLVDAAGPTPAAKLPHWPAALVDALDALAEVRRDARELPADRFVERLRVRSGLEVMEAARFLGPYRAVNLERFFRELAVALEQHAGDPAEALRLVRRGIEEQTETEAARPMDADGDALHVLTIHGAKGLEFRQVYVADLGAKSGGRPIGARTVLATEGGRPSYVLLGAPTLDFDLVEARRARVAAAEDVRLLYVACTRAQARLVLSAPWCGLSSQPQLARHLEHRARVVGDAGGLAGALTRDPFGAAWRLTALDEPVEPLSREAAVDAAPPSIPAARAQARELVAARARAAARAVRPLTAPMSSDAHRPDEEDDAHARAERSPGTPDWPRDAAMELGRAVHALLERLDLARARAAFPAALEDAHERLAAALAPRFGAGVAARARERLDELGARIAAGGLLARLETLAPDVLARELPLAAAPEEPAAGADARALAATPLAAWIGAADLVYRDRASGELVVVDHKTDLFVGADDRTQRIDAYRGQLTRYAAALGAALGTRTRGELWLLATGEVVPGATATGRA